MRLTEGNLNGAGLRVGIVVARFNQPITEKLLSGALDGLKRHGVDKKDIHVVWVPGSFEIPLIAKKLALSNQYDAVICLGAVIRGETIHFDLVAGQAASGILQASLDSQIPIIFSVIATESIEQAEVRAGTKGMNHGFSGALSAIEMVNVIKQMA